MRLHINIDHVATLRNARGTKYPDPVLAARACLDAGAHGITAHIREDRRHIKDDDVQRLSVELRGLSDHRGKSLFNLEMAATDEMVGIALATKPDVVTLVPERREERTTEGGLEVARSAPALSMHIAALRGAGIKVSLFIAPDRVQVEASRAFGVEQIELHTGEYAHGHEGELARLREASRIGHELGLEIAAGHGLTTENVPALMAIPEIIELNIGHAVVADSVFMGIGEATKGFLAAMKKGRS